MRAAVIENFIGKRSARAGILLLLLILVRAPFLNDVLCGEEGQFAFLVASPVPSAELSRTGLPRGLMANIDGQLYLGTFSRTIMPYLILENIVGSITRPMRVMDLTNPDYRAVAIHIIFLTLFLIGCIGAIWISAARSLPVILAVIWALSTPIAIGSSIQPQLDGTIGVLLLGGVAWVLSTSRQLVLLLFVGVLAGLGKHEWTMAFFVASIIVVLFEFIIIKNLDKAILLFMLGLFVGVGIAVIISYEDYVAGFEVMRNFYGEESSLYLARKNFKYLAPVVFIMTFCGLVIVTNYNQILKDNSLVFVLYLSGSAILCGFALSGHSPDLPRYYAPPLVIFIYVFLVIGPYCAHWIKNRGLLYLLLIVGFLFNCQHLAYAFVKDYSVTTCATTMPDLIRQREMYNEALIQNEKRQIPVISSGIWVYNPNVSFIEESFARSGGERLLKEYNKQDDFEIIEPMKCQQLLF